MYVRGAHLRIVQNSGYEMMKLCSNVEKWKLEKKLKNFIKISALSNVCGFPNVSQGGSARLFSIRGFTKPQLCEKNEDFYRSFPGICGLGGWDRMVRKLLILNVKIIGGNRMKQIMMNEMNFSIFRSLIFLTANFLKMDVNTIVLY